MEQLEERRSQCQTAYDQLRESEVTFDPSGKAEPEKATMLLAAIAKIQNKIAAMRFSERQKAQRAIKAGSTVSSGEDLNGRCQGTSVGTAVPGRPLPDDGDDPGCAKGTVGAWAVPLGQSTGNCRNRLASTVSEP